MVEPTTLAYLAGMIDGDGYITINRSVRKGKIYRIVDGRTHDEFPEVSV